MTASRTCFPALLLAASVGCAAAPKVDTAAEAGVIRQRFADWVAAEKNRDLETAVSFLTEDAVVQSEGAPAVIGREAAKAVWKGIFEMPYTDIADIEPRTVVVSASGDLAFDVGNFKVVMPGPNGAAEERGKSLLVWRKRNGEWMCVAISFTMDAPPAPPPAPAK
jgi:uncharacterized protein (TIGR02246 family)